MKLISFLSDTESGGTAAFMAVLILSLSIRLISWNCCGSILGFHPNGDSIEYYVTSINLEPMEIHKLYWGYSHWYERTPVYVLFLHLIHRELIIQVILSAIACLLMFKLNKVAGVLWMIYPQDIIYSFQYGKETLLLFFIICAIYVLRDKREYLLLAIPIIILGFVCYGGVISANRSLGNGFMSNFWELWKPAFNISVAYGKAFVYIQAVPYTLAMLYFIRHCRLLSQEFGMFLILSIVYGVIYGDPRYREPFMPMLFLYIGPLLQSKLAGWNFEGLSQKLSLKKEQAVAWVHSRLRPITGTLS